MQKHISSNSRSSGSDPTRRNSARRASVGWGFAAYSERRTRTSRYLGTARKARTRDKSIRHRTLSGLTRRLHNGFRYEATMSLLYSLARALDRFSPAPVAYAHCDIPCGIYDPHHAQMAAHTVVRMIDLINQLEKPGPNATPEQRQEYNAKLARYVFVKEQHAEIAKAEVRILWGDYFKPDHLKTFQDLHDLVWKAPKSGSNARQEKDLQPAVELHDETHA